MNLPDSMSEPNVIHELAVAIGEIGTLERKRDELMEKNLLLWTAFRIATQRSGGGSLEVSNKMDEILECARIELEAEKGKSDE